MYYLDYFVRLEFTAVELELTQLDDFKSPQWYQITEMGILPVASSVLELLKIIKDLGHLKK